MALGPGSIAFVGFSADGPDNLAFVALEPIAAGTVITFTDKEWNGSSFNTGEATWNWTATSDITAGTVVAMDGLAAGQTATSNLGTIAFSDATQRDIGNANETVYAYVGEASAPGFLAAIGNDAFTSANGLLTNTGLVQGQTAISLAALDADADVAAYAGIRGGTSFDALLPIINNPANWIAQDAGTSNESDGLPPDVPFSTQPFVGDPNLQTVSFADSSLSISHVEGDSGETVFTFTVERSGGTTGIANFSGTIDLRGTTHADDFVGPLTFTGTIDEGQTSATVTVHVPGDVLFEPDETFALTLRDVSNASVGIVVGGDAVATGTIVNDDVASLKIAFVGYNADGAAGLAFVALSDIPAGTVIHFANSEWDGSSFRTVGTPSSSGPGFWSWTAGADIAAGAVITMDALDSAAATSNLGAITPGSITPDFRDDHTELVYAYLGTPEAPESFLAGFSNTSTFISQNATLAGTGLVPGVNAVALGAASGRLDIAYYNGPRTGETSVESYLSYINNPANWATQENFAVDTSVDGVFPDVPFPAFPFSSDPAAQIVQFASGSLSVTQPEGTSGDTAFTFTVERTNGTAGDLTFTVRVPAGTYSTATNAADFVGGALPVITGTILDGENSATITILVRDENFYEVNERFQLMLTSASNPDASSVAIGSNAIAVGNVTNDDNQPAKVLAGEHHSATIVLTGETHFEIEQGGSTGTVTWQGGVNVVIDNGGETGSVLASDGTTGTIVINNLATGIMRGVVSAEDGGRQDFTLNNAGLIALSGDRMDLRDAGDGGGTVVVNNLAGGVIMQTNGGQDIMRPGVSVTNNYGSIVHAAGFVGGSSDGIDLQSATAVVNNYAGGLIEASRHAVTGDAGVQVYNEGTLIGRNGSAVNIDNNGTEAERAFVTNRGNMEGRSAHLADSDGDAVDIDGLVTLVNFGRIAGMGHNGYHDGEPNVSEGLAIGGGTITNHAGGEIYGYGRAIQVDNSSNSNALGTTTIVNHGLIRGDGNLPTGVTPEEVAQFAERIRGGEAINLLGNYGDVVTNTGQIVGGVKMGGGNDLLTNKGTMTATGGSAADLGDGNDTFEAHAGSTVNGTIDGGGGEDTLKLIGPGVGSVGVNVNFENLAVQSGIWTLQSDAYDSVSVATGAMVMSQLKLNDQGAMTVAAGGSVLVTNGSDAVVAEGSASIVNTGLIQAFGMNGATPAKAITLNGGSVHNNAGGVIQAMGVAIATGAAAVAAAEITNEGVIQSLTGQAIALSGDQDDTVTNKSMIMGSVDLGAGDDTLSIHTGSSISGAITGGEGTDTLRLVGTTPITVGGFNSNIASGFETLVVAEGTWTVTGSEVYSAITIEDGATVTSTVTLSNDDELAVEAGGKLVSATAITWTGGGDAVVENAGLIEASSRMFNTTNGATGSFTFNNEAGGVVRGALSPQQRAAADAAVTINNAGMMEASGRVIDFQNLASGGTDVTINNLAGGTIRQTGSDTDVIRPGQNAVVNNWGTITTAPGFAGGGDLIDYQSSTGGKVNNNAGGFMEASRHVVTGDNAVTVTNAGTMIGRNGSAVNIDNGGSEAEKVFITNRGTMEGRSAELSDSDGDAVDVDGLAQILNYGRIAGTGAEGYHDGEPNVSEGIAIGGGTIVNNATGEIYGYGRGIQVDNSSNSNALGSTTIVNDGLIQGDGHGPEGVDPQDAARFDLRGNEAINLVGDYEDFVGNNSTGRIVGGISMGGGRDTLNNSGSIVATGGSAIDMGDGNDQLNLYVGSTVTGMILLGDGDDVANSTSAAAYVIDGGDGNDSIAMYYTIFGGDDVLFGGAGNDTISGGLGEDRIAGGLDNDTLYGENGDDLIEGGEGDDHIDGGADDDVMFGDAGDDTLLGGLGNDVIKGNAGDDTIVVTSTADGRDSYDGGAGIDTLDFSALSQAVNLTLKDSGAATFATDSIENIENVIGGSANDKLTGGALDNMLFGNGGDDTLKGGAGDDTLDGGAGNDNLDGGANDDQLAGGEGGDTLKGAAGNDELDGGAGVDSLDGGAGNDLLFGGSGADSLTGGAGMDQFVFNSVGEGVDTIADFKATGSSADQIVLSASMFQNFGGDDPFDLIGSGFLRAVASGGTTQIQIDVDGGGNSFVALANLNGTVSNGVLADHVVLQWDLIA
jgi:hypothetical protein